MQKVLPVTAITAALLVLVFNTSKCKYIVDNQKHFLQISLNDIVVEEVDEQLYRYVLFASSDMNARGNLEHRHGKAKKVADMVVSVMKRSCNS